VVWEAGDRICGKRLKAALPGLVESLEKHGHLLMDGRVREKLLAVSPATIDRLLEPTRLKAGRKRRQRKKPNSVQRKVPIRTHKGADQLPPGYFEVDFVVHNGGVTPGSCAHTFVLTDIASGWTECIALVAREQSLVVESLKSVRPHLPIRLVGFDSDNDSAFMNDTLFDYCKNEAIEMTRSRPYKKNDQAWVEQKNCSIVRHFSGYARFEGLAATQALARLYRSVRLYVNYFQPSFKLRKKERIGAKVKRYYYPPATPCDRLLANENLDIAGKNRLRQERKRLDPVQLLHEIREAQAALSSLPTPPPASNLQEFLEQLPSLWKDGEVRPTHQEEEKPPRTWRTRTDPFERTWPKILQWLEDQPDVDAKALLARLQLEYPEQYESKQLRTLQRRVQKWRQDKAKEIVFASHALAQLSHTNTSKAGPCPAPA